MCTQRLGKDTYSQTRTHIEHTDTSENFTRVHAANRKINVISVEYMTAAINSGNKFSREWTTDCANNIFSLSFSLYLAVFVLRVMFRYDQAMNG